MTYFFHTCLLMILFTIFSIQDKIKPNIKSIGKFIIFTIIIVLFNYFISNSHLLWIFALINVVLYESFIQFIFHKNITDSLYLSISYWICIEMVDLIFQFCRIDYLNLTSNYLFMFVLIIIMYVPYLYLEKVEKKIWIFILPITLCFFTFPTVQLIICSRIPNLSISILTVLVFPYTIYILHTVHRLVLLVCLS